MEHITITAKTLDNEERLVFTSYKKCAAHFNTSVAKISKLITSKRQFDFMGKKWSFEVKADEKPNGRPTKISPETVELCEELKRRYMKSGEIAAFFAQRGRVFKHGLLYNGGSTLQAIGNFYPIFFDEERGFKILTKDDNEEFLKRTLKQYSGE